VQGLETVVGGRIPSGEPNASLDLVACFSRIDKCMVRSEETRELEGQRPDGER
jgi:hypothetical protein